MKSWKTYFIELTLQVASKSKDPSRQVGCIIVGPDKEIRSTGFNGFPRGVAEDVCVEPQAHFVKEREHDIVSRDIKALCTCGHVEPIPLDEWDKGNLPAHFTGAPRPEDFVTELNERWERPQKYDWVEHAERNAIYNAARMGIPLKGCSAFITLAPCAACSRALIQSGIVEVYGPAFPNGEEYKDYGFDKSQIMLREGGINYVVMEDATEDTA
jgi:deoxycytidylate deaminase